MGDLGRVAVIDSGNFAGDAKVWMGRRVCEHMRRTKNMMHHKSLTFPTKFPAGEEGRSEACDRT